jgi:phenylacetate-CoA ligase
VNAIAQAIDSSLSFRPAVRLVERGSLPRFELKARRFHIQK